MVAHLPLLAQGSKLIELSCAALGIAGFRREIDAHRKAAQVTIYIVRPLCQRQQFVQTLSALLHLRKRGRCQSQMGDKENFIKRAIVVHLRAISIASALKGSARSGSPLMCSALPSRTRS